MSRCIAHQHLAEPFVMDERGIPNPNVGLKVFTLAELMGAEKTANLYGSDDALHVALPVPANIKINELLFTLKGIASRNLNGNSQMLISLNQHIIKQYSLQTNGAFFHYQIPIPVEYVEAGYNDLTIKVIQHYSDSCERADAKQLWSQIDLQNSVVSIAASEKEFQLSLSKLDEIFDKKTWVDIPLIPVYSSKKMDGALLNALSLIAQGLGNRYDYHPINILNSSLDQYVANEPNQKLGSRSNGALLVGTFDEMKTYLEQYQLPTSGSPIIAIKPMKENPHKFVLFFAASNHEDLIQVSKYFALKSIPWPDLPWVAISKLQIPTDAEVVDAFKTSTSKVGAYPIKALGFQTHTYYGAQTEGSVIRVWNNSWQGRMQVRVHMSYASGMSRLSAMNILTNGVMHGSIPLDNEHGGIYENYAVTIPSGALKLGWNVLEFKPVLVSLTSKRDCSSLTDGNLAATLYDDTTIQQFGGSPLQQLDLGQLNGKGAPFTDLPLGRDIAIQVVDANNDNISTAMTLIAKLTQLFDGPLINLSLTTESLKLPKHIFMIGEINKLPNHIKTNILLERDNALNIKMSVAESASVEVRESTWFNWVEETLGLNRTPPPKKIWASTSMTGDLSTLSFVSSSKVDHQYFTVLTSNSATTLNQGINQLVDYGLWSQLSGKQAFWALDSNKVTTVDLKNEPFTAYGLRGGLGLWISKYPWLALFEILAVIILLVFATRRTLDFYSKSKNSKEDKA